jgi:hypothetical protein
MAARRMAMQAEPWADRVDGNFYIFASSWKSLAQVLLAWRQISTSIESLPFSMAVANISLSWYSIQCVQLKKMRYIG